MIDQKGIKNPIFLIIKKIKMKKIIASNPAKNENLKSAISINLEKYADQLSGINLKEKKDKESLYLYPDGFLKSDISSEKGKKYRNGLRNKLKKFSNNILIFAKIKDAEKLQKEIADFMIFYKEKFRINDLSLSSISHSKDSAKEKDFSLFLQIVKECK